MIEDRLKELKHSLPEGVTLVAVSKTKPSALILEAYEAGQHDFGENKVQEMAEKASILPKDIRWHLIGHLQTNKVKYIAPFVHLIHSVDSLKLLAEINKQALKNNRIIDCLLQFHVAQEETKFGLSIEEAEELLKSSEYANMKNIRLVGVMGMASFTENKMQVRKEFRELYTIFDYLKHTYFNHLDFFKERSMGMSSDYKIAEEEGSTMIRIGSTIFGERNLHNN
jgi:pyridoxal phosphate enzyme (YggS family)